MTEGKDKVVAFPVSIPMVIVSISEKTFFQSQELFSLMPQLLILLTIGVL